MAARWASASPTPSPPPATTPLWPSRTPSRRIEHGRPSPHKRGVGKTFDIFAGESVRVLAVYDPDARERELVMTKKAEEFDDA